MLYEVITNLWINTEMIDGNSVKSELMNYGILKYKIVNIDKIFEDETQYSSHNRTQRKRKIDEWRNLVEELYEEYRMYKPIVIYTDKNMEWIYYFIVSWVRNSSDLTLDKIKRIVYNRLKNYVQVGVNTFWDDVLMNF
jgi:hypothetical protein